MALTQTDWLILAGAWVVWSILTLFFIHYSNKNLYKKVHQLNERERQLKDDLTRLLQSIELLKVELNEKWIRLEENIQLRTAREIENHPVLAKKR